MIVECILPNAKQDKSQLFREELAKDAKRLAVFAEYDAELSYWFSEVTRITAVHSAKNAGALNMEIYLDVVRGFLTFHRKPGWKVSERKEGGYTMKRHAAGRGESAGMSKWAVVGDTTVQRESDITGDDRCKQSFTCRLSVLEAKYAFLNSQSLEQMRATEASESDGTSFGT